MRRENVCVRSAGWERRNVRRRGYVMIDSLPLMNKILTFENGDYVFFYIGLVVVQIIASSGEGYL